MTATAEKRIHVSLTDSFCLAISEIEDAKSIIRFMLQGISSDNAYRPCPITLEDVSNTLKTVIDKIDKTQEHLNNLD